MYRKKYHMHFVGIGGIGMSGIAELLLNLGYRVSGTDLRESEITRRLQKLGGNIRIGHAKESVQGADVVVVSSAVQDMNVEVVAARDAGIPVIPRAEMLAELMRLKFSVAIAGAHGKTTTTSIVAAVLAAGEKDPTVVIGGKLLGIGTNAMLGHGEFIVAEADESDGSFLKMSPSIAVVTNIDREHLDHYGSLANIKEAFASFLDRVPFYGISILCLDSEPVQDLLPAINKRHMTYGLATQADVRAIDIQPDGLSTRFSVVYKDNLLGEIELSLPGLHNVYNSLASICVGLELDIDFARMKNALENLEGVARRLETKGEQDGILVVDDYGHHPTEIRTTLSALRESWPKKRLLVAFQPHRYSRTEALFDDFVRSFYQADSLLVLPIYAAGEKPVSGVDSESLVAAIRSYGHKNVQYVSNMQEGVNVMRKMAASGDLLLTLGAGDVYRLGETFLASLKESGRVTGEK